MPPVAMRAQGFLCEKGYWPALVVQAVKAPVKFGAVGAPDFTAGYWQLCLLAVSDCTATVIASWLQKTREPLGLPSFRTHRRYAYSARAGICFIQRSVCAKCLQAHA